MNYSYPDLDQSFEHKYLANLIKYLGLRGETKLKSLLEGSQCIIRPTINSFERFPQLITKVYFGVQIERFSQGLDYDKQKLIKYCDDMMPKDFGYHIDNVEISPLIDEIGENVEFVPSTYAEDRNIIVISPKIFKVPETLFESNLVSVMMPFDVKFNNVLDTIKLACSNLELDCKRVDDIWNHSEIIQDIFDLIIRSSFVIVDFSGKNSNVFYEAGIAHTLGIHVIPITQNIDDIPFDLRHHRVIEYLNNSEGLEELRTKLESRLGTLLQKYES